MFAFKTFCRVIYREATTFLSKNWFNLFLIGALFQFSNQNKVDFEFAVRTSTVLDELENISTVEPISSENRKSKPKLVETNFSLGGFSSTPKVSNDEITNQIPKNSKAQNPSNRSFLSFIFHSDPSGKHPIDPTLLDLQVSTCNEYIERFAPVAVSEMNKYGIPASIKLAQALLESNAGKSQLSTKQNNHFGIKCFSKKCKKAHCANFTDDSHKDFFRNYENAWTSFRGHSLFLQNSRYKHLQEFGTADYKNWAYGLKEVGYATDPAYAEKLIRIIEFLNLDRFDQ